MKGISKKKTKKKKYNKFWLKWRVTWWKEKTTIKVIRNTRLSERNSITRLKNM
jgi:hypothetical protein